ncbi:hypothetical protein EB796_016377 [Bugula neritina]|uniref:Uncharacterized protein n=1 Tax=Bugula neritina TaxID=10212 RepID=A0A7J7JG67_BUGNE|nr:hypothetical protein EB796_016377 [Bugula neritina]
MIIFNIIISLLRPRSGKEFIYIAFLLSALLYSARMIHAPFESVPLAVHLINGGYDCAILSASAIVHYILR